MRGRNNGQYDHNGVTEFEVFTIFNIFNFTILEYSEKLCTLIDKPPVFFNFYVLTWRDSTAKIRKNFKIDLVLVKLLAAPHV